MPRSLSWSRFYLLEAILLAMIILFFPFFQLLLGTVGRFLSAYLSLR